MKSIRLNISTAENISSTDHIDNFFCIMEKYDILPEKIGLYDPLKTPYSIEEARNLWINPSNVNGFIRGYISAERKKPKIKYCLTWHKGTPARVNSLTLFFEYKDNFGLTSMVQNIFKDLIVQFKAVHGSISEMSRGRAITGTLLTRIPGIYWCNFFSKTLIDFLSEAALNRVSWYSTEPVGDGKLYLLAENPEDPSVSIESDRDARVLIGIDYFGDFTLCLTDPFAQPKTIAPPINLSKL